MALDKIKEVEVFIPCCIDQCYPQIAFNTLKLLKGLGLEAYYNEEQTCCGKHFFENGFWDEAKKLGEKFIEEFDTGNYVVTPSSSCAIYVRKYYKKLFFNTSLHMEYRRLQNRVFEISDFLVNVLRLTDFGAVFEHKVTYHDSCSALEDNVIDEPRILLSNVKGLQLIEMDRSKQCCGYGGGLSSLHGLLADSIVEQKVSNALATGAEYIVSTDSTCLGHIENYINRNNLPIKCIHIVDILINTTNTL